MSDSLIGTMIAGKYRIHRLLGTGGMGAVYAGEHLEIGKRVAIKVINESHANSPEVAARFRREARAASAVESASIVHVFDVGHDPVAGLYMVMEYLDGEDLASRLGRETKISAEDVVAIGFQSCRALAKAHAAGVIHRDLKPANIYLTTREDDSLLVKILDFGISKLLNDAAAASQRPNQLEEKKALTRMGAAIGTPQYMSPEQAQGLELDQRSDVWSMGACLYEALAGKPLYDELGTYEQTIIRIVMTPAAPLGQVAPWVPRALAEVVDAALVHDVNKRIPDCATFARRLKESVGADTNNPSTGAHNRLSNAGASHAVANALGGGPTMASNPSGARVSATPMNPMSSTLPIDSFASTVAADSFASTVMAPPTHAPAPTPQPDFTRTAPLRGYGAIGSQPPMHRLPLPPPGTSTGTAVMMPEPSIPGVGSGFPILLAVGGLLLATVVAVGGIFVVTSRGHASAPASSSAAAVVSVAPPQVQPAELPRAVSPIEAIVPIGSASVAPVVVPPVVAPVVSAKPAAVGAAIAPATSHNPHGSPKASAGPTPATSTTPPPKSGQFGGAGVDQTY
ncbi:MAG: serine/threonine protein kinase with repeat [Myxococcaceae bacterium]|nr:serine/threonine protein kinase with repeat [Myxococcaceae bacterium]